MRTYHIPIFVPHKGCPHDCVFCNQRQITGQDSHVAKEDVYRIIEENLATITGQSYIEVAFFGGSFTGIEFDMQTELLSAACSYVKEGRVNGIRCSTRADYIDDTILDNLQSYGVTAIELGVQSTDREVLKLSRRGHTFEDVVRASRAIKQRNIELGLQMMLGLPGDTRERMLKTARDLIALEPSCVRIYPTLVVPHTALWQMYEKGMYTPLTVDKTVEILAEVMPMFLKEGINIIRVGLQTTDNINENTVRGPYHPAIRELAESRIIRDVLEEYMPAEELEVSVNPRRISATSGHKRCNKEYFDRVHKCRLFVKGDKLLGEKEMLVNGKTVTLPL